MFKNKKSFLNNFYTGLALSIFILVTNLSFISFISLAHARPENIALNAKQSAEKAKIVIFTASWCHYCTKLRAFLNTNKIKFTEYDIEQSQLGYQLYRSLGGKGIPVIKIADTVIYGYNPDKLKQVLNNHGYTVP